MTGCRTACDQGGGAARPLFVRVLAVLLLTCALVPLARADAVVFIYHRFGEGQHPSTSVTLDQFRQHLDHLQRSGFEVWPLSRLVMALQTGAVLPAKVTSITIDDGFASIHGGAWPLLRERGLPATVFLNTDFLDRQVSGYLSWDQVREMRAAGIEFANHGASHERLWRQPGETEAHWQSRVQADIARAQARLQAELGADTNEAPRLFAFPYGEYDRPTAALVAKMRYVAFGQHSGAIHRLDGPDAQALPRFAMAERYADAAEFAEKAGMRALPVVRWQPEDPRDLSADPPRLEVVLADGAWRDRVNCYFLGERLEVRWRSDDSFVTRASRSLDTGRNRYNCTARDGAGRWHWLSVPFIK